MAKYNWKQLEKEYILGEYKSVSAFLKEKNIPNNGSTKKSTKGWKNKKVLKEEEKSTKTIEKTIEKQSTEDAKKIVKVNDVANELLVKVLKATSELNIHTDMFGGQHTGIIDRADIKKLTSALKDINDILDTKKDKEENLSNVKDVLIKIKEVANNDR